MVFPRSGELAQLGERLVCNQEVTGSSPVFSTSLRPSGDGSVSQPPQGDLSRRSRPVATADSNDRREFFRALGLNPGARLFDN